jgi:hypothetical protein
MLRVWWILSALVAIWLLVKTPVGDGRHEQILAGLAIVNATAAFAGTAIVGRLMLVMEKLERSSD